MKKIKQEGKEIEISRRIKREVFGPSWASLVEEASLGVSLTFVALRIVCSWDAAEKTN